MVKHCKNSLQVSYVDKFQSSSDKEKILTDSVKYRDKSYRRLGDKICRVNSRQIQKSYREDFSVGYLHRGFQSDTEKISARYL